jgi:cell division protein FtsB
MSGKKVGVISMATFWWILIIVIVGGMSAVILYPKMQAKSKKIAELQSKQAVLVQKEAERNLYMEKVDNLNNDKDTVERVAKEKYNLFRKEEKVIHYSNK